MENFISLDFDETLNEIFERCDEQGMELPWIVCLVSPNGCTTVMRISGKGMPGDVLAEHSEPEGFQLPMTIVVVDQHNAVVTVRIEVSANSCCSERCSRACGSDRFLAGILEQPPPAISRVTSRSLIRLGGRHRMGEARNGAWRNPMAEAPGSVGTSAETRAIRAAVEAARMAKLLAAGHTPAELGYPAELVAKEIVRREWRAWYDAYKSFGH